MPLRSSSKQLLLIGASRGLGLALAEEYLKRGWRVVATERDSRPSSLHDLAQAHVGRLEIERVDINRQDQVDALRARLAARQFDMLFVNAGVTTAHHETAAEVSTEEFVRVMVTNALSPLRVIEALQDVVRPDGTIGVMSSGRGSIANNENGHEDVYRGSKAALNMFMRSFAARHAHLPRTLLLMAPGWVRTDMGGPDARLTIADSIPNLADVMDAQTGRPGLRYLDYLGRQIPW
ncbi:MAG: Dehydrogenases with different specificities (related to short-chain alcohol dehydrogenases) [Rhodanobacteraceae bacterium]|jgi:NAD(P)-dependent dehydrogenase (short-subunit alcohol dehydrogenase family)|nr:MAG: Dehydrogenases with different specificities (related to short-chain alcohol dehydrogenases) [Rhodanobacteraceae bacterium]